MNLRRVAAEKNHDPISLLPTFLAPSRRSRQAGERTIKSDTMINPDDIEPRAKPAKPRDLTQMSVGDLQDYITALETEITRVEAAIAKKEAHRSGVEALFGKPKE